MSEWRHVPTMYDGSWGLRAQTCRSCGAIWPCDAETERNKRLEMAGLVNREHEKHAAAEARALAAEGERDRLRAAIDAVLADLSKRTAFDIHEQGPKSSEAVGINIAIGKVRAALTGAKE